MILRTVVKQNILRISFRMIGAKKKYLICAANSLTSTAKEQILENSAAVSLSQIEYHKN